MSSITDVKVQVGPLGSRITITAGNRVIAVTRACVEVRTKDPLRTVLHREFDVGRCQNWQPSAFDEIYFSFFRDQRTQEEKLGLFELHELVGIFTFKVEKQSDSQKKFLYPITAFSFSGEG